MQTWLRQQQRRLGRGASRDNRQERPVLDPGAARPRLTWLSSRTRSRSSPRRTTPTPAAPAASRIATSRSCSSPTARSTGPARRSTSRASACDVDQGKDNYEVMPNRARDGGVQRRERQGNREGSRCAVNDYGSFSGSFTAPRDRLMGRMMHPRRAGLGGGTHFNVEEYKRPKFQVDVDAPKEAFKLNDTVKVPGKAMPYTGVPVGGAKVAYRVDARGPLPGLVLRVLLVAAGPEPAGAGDRQRHRARPSSTAASRSRSPREPDLRGAREGRADVPVHDHGRRDRHHRRDADRHEVRAGRLRRSAGDDRPRTSG